MCKTTMISGNTVHSHALFDAEILKRAPLTQKLSEKRKELYDSSFKKVDAVASPSPCRKRRKVSTDSDEDNLQNSRKRVLAML